MKYKKTFLLAFMLSSMLLLYSCSETTSTNDVKNYFPNSVGNYWIYQNFDLDSLGNKIQTSVDSTVITGTQNLFGKNSDIYSKFVVSGGTSQANYYSEKGRFYSTLANVMPPRIPIPLDYQDAWVVIANPDSISWTIFSQTLTDVEITLSGGITGKLNGVFSIKGEKGLKQNVNTGEGQTINVMAQEYKILYSFSGTFTPSSLPVPLNLNFTVTSHRWYGENIGLVLDRVDPLTIQVSIFTQNIKGSESGMLRYHISQ